MRNDVTDVLNIVNELKERGKFQLTDYEILKIAVQMHNGQWVSNAIIDLKSAINNGTQSPFNVRIVEK